MKLYVKTDCPMCAEIVIPEGVKVNKIDVDKDYDGYVPASVPILQLNPMFNAEGSQFINEFLDTIKKAQDGLYRE